MDLWAPLADFAAEIWAWLSGLLTWIMSAFAASFEAMGNFIMDWIYYGWDWAKTRQLAALAGVDIQIPTLGEAIAALPHPMPAVLARVGIPEAAQILSGAIATQMSIAAFRLSSWLIR